MPVFILHRCLQAVLVLVVVSVLLCIGVYAVGKPAEINLLDRRIIVAYLLVTVVMFIAIDLSVERAHSVRDPRVRASKAGK